MVLCPWLQLLKNEMPISLHSPDVQPISYTMLQMKGGMRNASTINSVTIQKLWMIVMIATLANTNQHLQ